MIEKADMTHNLQDAIGDEHDIKCLTKIRSNKILVHAYGYGSKHLDNDSYPIMIENYEGVLRVIIWADINQEDPTHIISLLGARVENRIGESETSW